MKRYLWAISIVLLKTCIIFSHEESTSPVVISLGHRCQVAIQTRVNNLRESAYPFDWTILPFKSLYNLIKNDFVGFLDKENLKFIYDKQYSDDHGYYHPPGYRYVKDTKYNVIFRHDFPHNENFMEKYEIIKQKYDRRIKRFYEAMASGKPIIFIRRIISRFQALTLKNLLIQKFPSLEFTLIAVDHLNSIKQDWRIPRVINAYIPFPKPYNRQGDYAQWTALFKRIGLDPKPMKIEIKDYPTVIHPLYNQE